MCVLKPIDGSELTEYVINLLNKNNICTAIKFLAFDEKQLSKITNLPVTQIAALKVKLRRIYGPQVVHALHYSSCSHRNKYTTGIRSLDTLLGDQFLPGKIYEICGNSASGKTLLCTTIALHFIQTYSAEVLYLDSKRDFCSTRTNRILNANGVAKVEIGRIMQMIKVKRCYNLREMIELLETLLNCLKKKKVAFKLVIVESLPAVWYLFHGEDGSKKGKSLITKCANLLKQIAKDHQLFVITVNVIVRNISEEEPLSTMDVEDRTEMAGEQQLAIEQCLNMNPSLGKCWDGVPTIRLILEDPFYEVMINSVSHNHIRIAHDPLEDINKDQRVVRIMKSCFSTTGAECTINVSDTGGLY